VVGPNEGTADDTCVGDEDGAPEADGNEEGVEDGAEETVGASLRLAELVEGEADVNEEGAEDGAAEADGTVETDGGGDPCTDGASLGVSLGLAELVEGAAEGVEDVRLLPD